MPLPLLKSSRNLVAGLAAALAIASMGISAARADEVNVSLAMNPWIGYGPWYIAKAKGFDKSHGVSIQFVTMGSYEAFNTALAAGNVDSGHAVVTSALQLQNAGVAFKAVLFQDISTTGDAVIAGASVKTAKDLAGKKIAFPKDSGSEVLLRLTLERAGLSLKDVQTVDLPADQAAVAFMTGRVDAAVTYEPYIANARKALPDMTEPSTAGEFPGVISDFWIVNPGFAAAHPDAVVGMLQAWDDSVKYLRQDQADGIRIIAAASSGSVSADDLTPTYNSVKMYDLQESAAFMRGDLPELGTKVGAMMKAAGKISGDKGLSDLIDTSYITKALGR